MPVLAVTTVLNLLYGLKVFDIVFVLTNGGPGRATDTVYTAIFEEFSKGRYGVATTLSTLLFLIMIVLGYFVIRLMHREEAGVKPMIRRRCAKHSPTNGWPSSSA